MPATYEPIASTTLGSASSGVTFSSIASTYTDLIVTFFGKPSTNFGSISLQFNSDTASNYSVTDLYGNGSTAGSSRGSNYVNIPSANWLGHSDTVDSIVTFNIQSYCNTNTFKTVLVSVANQASSFGVTRSVGLWRSTSAINTVKVYSPGGDVASGAVVSLYGIKAA